jgi:hypothetical protein
MGQWWLLGENQVPIGPVTTELVLQGIRAGKVPPGALACEVGGSAWRTIRSVGRFASAFAKRIDGPTLVDLDENPITENEDPPTLANAKLRFLDNDEDERTLANGSPILLDDIGSSQPMDETSEVTIVDRAPRPSEPPP